MGRAFSQQTHVVLEMVLDRKSVNFGMRLVKFCPFFC